MTLFTSHITYIITYITKYTIRLAKGEYNVGMGCLIAIALLWIAYALFGWWGIIILLLLDSLQG